MKLWILSDLHIESCQWDLPFPAPEHDVLIAAGDIHDPASDGVSWLYEGATGKPIIYVPGNHEWYAHKGWFSVEGETQRAKDLAAELGVHFLMDEAITIDGVRFLGASLWTDFELFGDREYHMFLAAKNVSDHHVIYPDYTSDPLSPAQSREWDLASRAWLESELPKKGDWDRTVVVTHHLPHPRSIAPRWITNAITPAFCSDLSDLVESCGAALWVHGHTHDSFDYVAGSTRVICNPKGYGPRRPGAPIENQHFDPSLVVTI